MKMKASYLAIAALWILLLGSTLSMISAAVTTDFTFALQKDDYAIWSSNLNQTTSMGGTPTNSITAMYEKRVVKDIAVISGGNECNFTVDIYLNNTANPSMVDASHWTLNSTKHSILNKTVEGMMNATPIYPKDVGLDEIYTNEYIETLTNTLIGNPYMQNSTAVTYYILKNDTSNNTYATATSGGMNFTFEFSYRYNMSSAPTTFYVSEQVIFMEYNTTINGNHLVDYNSMFMNMTMLMYAESDPGNPTMNMTVLANGIADLQYTHIGGGGLDPMIIMAIVIGSAVAVVVIVVAVVVKKRRSRP
jgi:hypothetical protein